MRVSVYYIDIPCYGYIITNINILLTYHSTI
jgi:hypothetical protein